MATRSAYWFHTELTDLLFRPASVHAGSVTSLIGHTRTLVMVIVGDVVQLAFDHFSWEYAGQELL